MATQEKVFIIGGTGNVGSVAVRRLISKNIPVTLLARTPEKVTTLFGSTSLVSVVKGEYDSYEAIEEGIKDHTRLFILVQDLQRMAEIKSTIAKIAFKAGVKQIVDLSAISVSSPWRTSAIGNIHGDAEKALLDVPNRGFIVTLRPGRFMSNVFIYDRGVRKSGVVRDVVDRNRPQGWVSTEDIGEVAAVVLSEDVEKHGDGVYELNSDVVTPAERANILASLLKVDVAYQQVSSGDQYAALMRLGFLSHLVAMELSSGLASHDMESPRVSGTVEVLLGRPPQTLVQFFVANAERIQ